MTSHYFDHDTDTSSNDTFYYETNTNQAADRDEMLGQPYTHDSDVPFEHQPPGDDDESSEYCPMSPLEGTWPPHGYRRSDRLDEREALSAMAGAAAFTGQAFADIRTGHDERRLYHAETSGELSCPERLCPTFSMTLGVRPAHSVPWTTLEQPSMLTAHGATAGTTTFCHWIAASEDRDLPNVPLISRVVLRDIKPVWALDRVEFLQLQVEPDMFERYETLYQQLIISESRVCTSTIESDLMDQITDLVDVLHTTRWIDFSRPENQLISTYLHTPDRLITATFFIQLVLSMELYRRLELLTDQEKEDCQVYSKLPLIVAYDVALAELWIKGIAFHKKKGAREKSFEFLRRDVQMAHLYDFASDICWPSLRLVEDSIRAPCADRGCPLESRNAAALSWSTAIVLPGQLTSWLMMRTLVGMDEDVEARLAGLQQMRPNSGFQYAGFTYWYHECIVGKVLGISAHVVQRAGWIARCLATSTIKPTQYVVIQQEDTSSTMSSRKVNGIAQRTSPIGPPDEFYPVCEYEIPAIETKNYFPNAIKVKELQLRPLEESRNSDGHLVHEAVIIFKVNQSTVLLPLIHNVSFITAALCTNNPHALYYEYGHKSVQIVDLPRLKDWSRISPGSPRRGKHAFPPPDPFTSFYQDHDSSQSSLLQSLERVLVIEAFGGVDSEILARAWCSKTGHSAIVGDVYGTCTACAVRMAFAANVDVVILTNRQGTDQQASQDSGYHSENTTGEAYDASFEPEMTGGCGDPSHRSYNCGGGSECARDYGDEEAWAHVDEEDRLYESVLNHFDCWSSK